MTTKEAEVISQLVNYSSFSDAAQGLFYSASVITSYVNHVEAELGVKLFVRGNKSNALRLTKEGEILIKAIQRIDADYRACVELAQQISVQREPTLRIGSQPRYGNSEEQEIIASFLLKNHNAKLDRIKSDTVSLVNLLLAGRLDAIFLILQDNVDVENYIFKQGINPDIGIKFVCEIRNLYLGVSTSFLPGKMEADFGAFKDLTFTFAFNDSDDIQDQSALAPYEQLANKHGFQLKKFFFSGHDSSIFKLVATMPLAVCSTNVIDTFPNVKFMRISDWTACTRFYFIYNKNTPHSLLKALLDCVLNYIPPANQ